MNAQVKYDTKMIKNLPIFNELDERVIADILNLDERIIKIFHYRAGEKLITEKRFYRKMFLMMKGKVQVRIDTHPRRLANRKGCQGSN